MTRLHLLNLKLCVSERIANIDEGVARGAVYYVQHDFVLRLQVMKTRLCLRTSLADLALGLAAAFAFDDA